VNGRRQWGLKPRVIAAVLGNGIEVAGLMEVEEERGQCGGSSPCGEGGQRPTWRRQLFLCP
jgi:hypothetical protein